MLKNSLFNRPLRTSTRYIFFSSNRNDQMVGVDLKGNQYFELNNGGILSRQVKYITNEYDPSLVHPLWLPWLQYKTDVIPSDEELRQYDYDQKVLKMKIRKIEQRDDLERTFMRQNPEKYEEMCASPQSIRSMINSILEKNSQAKANANASQKHNAYASSNPSAEPQTSERQQYPDASPQFKKESMKRIVREPLTKESSRPNPTPTGSEPASAKSDAATSGEPAKKPFFEKPQKIEMATRQPGAGQDEDAPAMDLMRVPGKAGQQQQAEQARAEARDEAERREEEQKRGAPQSQSKLSWVDVNEDLL